jgi:formylglycine-generating enzyme required for sulfatase activity
MPLVVSSHLFLLLAYTSAASGQNAENSQQTKPAIYSTWPYDAKTAEEFQSETAKAINEPVELNNSIDMKLRLVPAGEFMMGSPREEQGRGNDEGPPHRVRITKPFYIGAYEVTLGQFRAFVDATNYKTDAEKDDKGGWGYTGNDAKPFRQNPRYTWRSTGFEQSDRHPAVNISWNDAIAFTQWLSKKESKKYRLPTEAEWEYACRAGASTRFFHGNDDAGIARFGNVSDQATTRKFAEWLKVDEVDRAKFGDPKHNDGHVFTAPVGSFLPNAFGLYDMHGNVWEWCSDWDAKDYYQSSPVDDPPGPTSGTSRIRRGGSWLHAADFARSARRRRYLPEGRNSPIGFRVALTSE